MISPRGRDMIIWITVFTILNFIALGLRFYTTLRIKRKSLGIDDYIIIFSILSLLSLEATTIWGIPNGFGFHIAYVQEVIGLKGIVINLKVITAAEFSWPLATSSCKVAILFTYLDIFRTERKFKWVVWGLIVLCTLFPIIFIPFFITVCDPVWAAWTPGPFHDMHCRPLDVQEIASVVVNLVLDSAVVLAPVPIVWKLQMPKNKKLGVTAMFSLGVGVIAISIWRLVDTLSPGHLKDLTYDIYILSLQSHLECWLGILAANIPALAPLLNRIQPSRLTKYIKSKNTGVHDETKLYGRGISLKTFGSSNVSSRPARDEFELLGKGSERGLSASGGIMMNHEFRVSIDSSPDQNIKTGHTYGIAT
ncbi:hypothetical protein HD806DRAFT_506125 [Xylariaceae sp. AK1471]|nr:hypothetical protein HD806DRAFT_506125 [Xylariaceae sp. AK1471]